MIERENTTHNQRLDDELAEETEGLVRGNRPDRADPFLDPEPPADDDPVVEGWNAERSTPQTGPEPSEPEH